MKVPLANAAALAASIGKRVRALRELTGLTQEKLAYESGLRSKGTLSKIESGQQLASLAVLELLARRLGVELFELLTQPSEGQLRHDVVEASRGASEQNLRAALRALSRTASAQRPPPFAVVPRPRERAGAPTAIPLLGLDVAAGGFDGSRVDRGTRWVRPRTTRRLHAGCFVARIVGRSMEPTLTDGAWAIFSSRVSDNPRGKIVIAQFGGLVDADTAASYTVKRFHAVPAPRESEARWSEVHLAPDNPAFETIVVSGDRLVDLAIVAELVEALEGEAS